jgi:V-type H+-transporting ATPase subunit d
MANYNLDFTVGGLSTFNINDGFLEAIVRGYRKGILSATDYGVLTQCDTLEDLKVYLNNSTDYTETFLQNEPSPIHTTTIAEHATNKLVEDFDYLRKNAVEPLSTFLDYITYGYMIDNVVLLISGTLHDRDTQELIEKCHPLGKFEAMETITVAQSVAELYRLIIIETPLAPYFKDTMREEDLDEMNVEIIRNTLYRSYLEDFYAFCQKLGGSTAEVMTELLKFEADRRSITITVNSLGTELNAADRQKLYPGFGHLYPDGVGALEKAEEIDDVVAACQHVGVYREILSGLGGQGEVRLDAGFFEQEVKINRLAFMEQMHYGVFYSYIKLREQEIRNIVWISECIQQDNREKISQFITIF